MESLTFEISTASLSYLSNRENIFYWAFWSWFCGPVNLISYLNEPFWPRLLWLNTSIAISWSLCRT